MTINHDNNNNTVKPGSGRWYTCTRDTPSSLLRSIRSFSRGKVKWAYVNARKLEMLLKRKKLGNDAPGQDDEGMGSWCERGLSF
ncbi:hypothetical protein TNIN_22131 [Trichonephila inaurata madagascariensis]|uniref:Uncharacterized protein n=1 Tax=Trichonephila inaurata madagascariensis TaxID=2747483 RepID=A0A8X6YB65_9ARAC|nr:hypothetical protein TNIN_22131 [Trichonephila inaurata madagascariensis]